MNMTMTKTAAILVLMVLGMGASMGLEAFSDFVIACIVALMATPLVATWVN